MNNAPTTIASAPQIPDHDLLRQIGEGSFGQVWIARSRATGRHRAVKLILRSRFHDDRPFEVEFAGVRKFEEVSREHEGFVDILHISRDNDAGYFAYVMELADDVQGGSPLDPDSYAPRTLAAELKRKGRLAPSECVRVALDLTAALGELHRRSLVHRDIKPTNIVFVRGAPKLADIGLVTEIRSDEAVAAQPTFTGTPDFIDPRVHGTARGDLFSFGKVLYQIATGLHPREFPSLPNEVRNIAEPEVFWELNRIFSKACDTDPAVRFTTAEEIHEELKLLNAGIWAIRWKRWLWLFKAIRRYGLLALCVLVFAGVAAYQRIQWQQKAAEVRQRKVLSYVANGARDEEDGNLAGALSWYTLAMDADENNPRTDNAHRLRIGSTLRRCPTVVQMWFHDSISGFPSFAGCEDRVLASTPDGRWAIYDVADGRQRGSTFGTGRQFDTAFYNPATHHVATACYTKSVWVWDATTGSEVWSNSLNGADVRIGVPTLSADGRWMAATVESPRDLASLTPAVMASTNSFGPAKSGAVVWDLQSPDKPPRLYPASATLWHIAFSPDARRLVASLKYEPASGREAAVVWDRLTGATLARCRLHTNWVYSCAFSPDGRRVASASEDHTVRVWDAETGSPLVVPLAHQDVVRAVEFSPDGSLLATAGWDSVVRIWRADTGRPVHRLEHNTQVMHAGFSPSGNHLLTLGHDGIVRVWDLRQSEHHLAPLAVEASGDGMSLAFTTNGQIQIRSADHDALVHTVPLTNQNLLLWRLNQNGSRVLTVFSNVTAGVPSLSAQVWAADSAAPVAKPMTFAGGTLPQLVFSPDGRWLLAGRELWNVDLARSVRTLDPVPDQAAFDPAGRRLALSRGNNVEVWSLAGEKTNRVHWTNHSRVSFLSWDSRGRRLAVCGANTGIVEADAADVRDPATGLRMAGPFGHYDGVLFAAFSGDGQKLATCGEDHLANIWALGGGGQVPPPLSHGDQVTHAAFSAGDRFVATAALDGAVRVWDPGTGEPLTTFFRHWERGVRRVQFIGGTRFLLTQTDSGAVRLWPLELETRPLADVTRIAQLLSGRQSHVTGSMMPQSKPDIQRLWREMRARYTNEFSFRP